LIVQTFSQSSGISCECCEAKAREVKKIQEGIYKNKNKNSVSMQLMQK